MICSRHLELLARAGINPTTVTLSALALAALLARVRNGQGGAHLLVDLDQGSDLDGAARRHRDAARNPYRGRRTRPHQRHARAGRLSDSERGAPDPARSQFRP